MPQMCFEQVLCLYVLYSRKQRAIYLHPGASIPAGERNGRETDHKPAMRVPGGAVC